MPALIAIPLLASLGWLWTAILALPIWLLWTVFGLGKRLFGFLPPAWQSVSLLDVAALLLMFAIVRTALTSLKFDLKI